MFGKAYCARSGIHIPIANLVMGHTGRLLLVSVFFIFFFWSSYEICVSIVLLSAARGKCRASKLRLISFWFWGGGGVLHLFTAIWQNKLWFVYQQELKILQFVDYLESQGLMTFLKWPTGLNLVIGNLYLHWQVI